MAIQINSEFNALLKRGFIELLSVLGTPIACNGIVRQCIVAPVDEVRLIEVTGSGRHVIDWIDILAEDFDFFDVVLNETQVTVDEKTMTVVDIKRDPQDPVVHFEARHDY